MNNIIKGRIITVFALLCYMSAFGIAGYQVSYKKGKIWNTEFTISQSLAFGNDPALVSLFTLGTMAYIYLLLLKGPKYLLYPRIISQVIIYIFLITIIWITTFRDKGKHYIFALIIFLGTLLYHIMTYIAYKNLKVSPLVKNILLGACILNILVFIGLGVTKGTPLSNYDESKITFASLENTVTVITGTVLTVIGFLI